MYTFLRALSFEGTKKLARNYLNQNFEGFIFEEPSTKFTLWIAYWGFYGGYISCGENVCPFCVSSFGMFFQKFHFPFLRIKRARESLGTLYVDP